MSQTIWHHAEHTVLGKRVKVGKHSKLLHLFSKWLLGVTKSCFLGHDWTPPCPTGKSKLFSYFARFAWATCALPISCLYLNPQVFYVFNFLLHPVRIQFSPPTSVCMGLSCLPGLHHNKSNSNKFTVTLSYLSTYLSIYLSISLFLTRDIPPQFWDFGAEFIYQHKVTIYFSILHSFSPLKIHRQLLRMRVSCLLKEFTS